MTNKVVRSSRSRKRAPMNWPTIALAGVAAVAVEGLIFALLWEYEPDHTVGVMYSIITGAFSLLGLCVSRAAGLLKADPRGAIRRRALPARLVSIALILPTVFIGGGAAALKMQDRAAIEYAGSEAYAATLTISKDSMGDSRVQAQAAIDLERAIRPTQVRMFSGEYVAAVLAFLVMTVLPSLAVGNGLTFAAETPAQEKRRLKAIEDRKAEEKREATNAKAQATRARNLAEAAKANGKPPFSLVRAVAGKD